METTTQVQEERVTGRPGSAAKLIREVRAKTRRKFLAEDKIRIVLEGFRKEMPVSDLCRREGISSALYYSWLKDFMEAGIEGLKRVRSERRIWNRLSAGEVQKVLEIARLRPELSPRLLALKITDEEDFSVYRILKGNGLIYPRPLAEMLAQKQWRHKTARPDELWQCDATNLFVVGWRYYKLIAVEADFYRKIIADDVRPDENAFSLSDILEMGLENAKKEGHLTGGDSIPKLYSDNSSGFTSKFLAEYLCQHGIKHIFGTPYHPQGRGKIERFNIYMAFSCQEKNLL